MALTFINRSFERSGRGELYLAAYPSSDPGSTIATRIKGYFQLFYTDGDERKTLSATYLNKPWANLTSDGISVKVKQNPIMVDPNAGSKHPIGIQDTDIEGEFAFYDVDPAHLADIASASTEELVAQAAATGKAGRSVAMLGGQASLTKYVAMYRMPSVLIPGEFDHYLFPRVTTEIDSDLKASKKDAISFKVKFTAQNDIYLLNTAGYGEQALADIANAVAL